jgi:hypothetical protein
MVPGTVVRPLALNVTPIGLFGVQIAYTVVSLVTGVAKPKGLNELGDELQPAKTAPVACGAGGSPTVPAEGTDRVVGKD